MSQLLKARLNQKYKDNVYFGAFPSVDLYLIEETTPHFYFSEYF